MGLFFRTPEEALTVLEERRDLVRRSLEIMDELAIDEQHVDELQALTHNHSQTLLEAERNW